jgi:hypothetical protein
MREISMKAGVETLIIALFVLLGVKVASVISGWVSQIKKIEKLFIIRN